MDELQGGILCRKGVKRDGPDLELVKKGVEPVSYRCLVTKYTKN